MLVCIALLSKDTVNQLDINQESLLKRTPDSETPGTRFGWTEAGDLFNVSF